MREAGTEIHGRFTLVRRLGSGMGGETWLAQDRDGGELAIKLLSTDSSQARSDLLREAQFLQGIVHERIVRYRGIVDLPGDDTCLFMDFVSGGDLERWMRRTHPHGMPVRRAAVLMLQLIEALDALHDVGVLHRDLKPKNILVSDPSLEVPGLLVADFGISKHTLGGQSDHTRPVGTPGYMAPEQYRSRTLTFAADLHALGGVGWFLATGSHPPEAGDLGPIAQARDSTVDANDQAFWAMVWNLRHPDPVRRGTLDQATRTLESIAEGTSSGASTADTASETLDLEDLGIATSTLDEPAGPQTTTVEVRRLPGWAAGLIGGLVVALALVVLLPLLGREPLSPAPAGGEPDLPPAAEPPAVEGVEPEVAADPPGAEEAGDTPSGELEATEAGEGQEAGEPAGDGEVEAVDAPGTGAAQESGGLQGEALPPLERGGGEPGVETEVPAPRGGTLKVISLDVPPADVTVFVDGEQVPRCTACTGEVVVEGLVLPPGRHQVVCTSPRGRDIDPPQVDIVPGEEAVAWCAPVWQP